MHHRSHLAYRRRENGDAGKVLAAATLGVLAGTVVLVCARQALRSRPVLQPEDAPHHTWRRHAAADRRETALVGRTITVNRPRPEVYARWRDFSGFPDFMENVHAVTPVGDKGARWVVAAPGGGTITFETTITDERPDELIAWKSDEGAEVRNSGRIVFRDAPGGRGTEVEATIAYDPPGGAFGRATAKLFQREPRIQTRRELKRFKQLMETGEVAVAGRTARHA
ncbi:SRPBCC family protein [Chelativorans sp. M5D2P16]|uniref:SRPBCC family protein n=1 Tax=Chelativorans sp. M5D2P16 TaxID=3095678 RepID=UPI002ACA2B7C|nr:SRPBCC family protein [Chelativorans sp. M5D2P16]MDZ5695916.1 SRPBCC family protein [Chelativorans sp. M5D2P16]